MSKITILIIFRIGTEIAAIPGYMNSSVKLCIMKPLLNILRITKGSAIASATYKEFANCGRNAWIEIVREIKITMENHIFTMGSILIFAKTNNDRTANTNARIIVGR